MSIALKPLHHPKLLGTAIFIVVSLVLILLTFTLSIKVSAYAALAMFLVAVALVSLRVAHDKVGTILHEELKHRDHVE
ncbi:hypothetical protein [Amycolatopsis sp. NPDC059657]|uniref:hypothetical protein n=1 Tax=Amycolatopsis sp. NPDC059657 TaxID=3346899 RepID=UPI00366C6159